MKILLIEPPFERFIGQRCEWFPIGLTSIATFLEKNGHWAKVYNAEHDNNLKYINTEVYMNNSYKYKEGLENQNHSIWEEIRNIVNEIKPDIVGISVKTAKIPSAFKIAEICKEEIGKVIVIAGGFHATVNPEDILKSDNIDLVLRGEGEETCLELVEKIKTNVYDFEQIKGISFKNAKGNLVNTPDRPLIKNLDKLPFPKRELILGYEGYTSEQLGWLMTSRGCPYDCTFCDSKAIWNRRVRFVGISRVMEEIDSLKNKFHIANFNIMDDSFTVNKKRVYEFCDKLKKNKLDITWSCLTRADLLDEDLLKTIKLAGCTKIDIGIESGSDSIQKLINKKIKLDDVRRISEILRKHNIFWAAFFMMGFPSETKEDILKTHSFMKEIKPNWVYLSIFTPYPGTYLYEVAKKEGTVSSTEMDIFFHQSSENCFSKNISPEEFKKLAKFMFKEFNEYNHSMRNLVKRAFSRNYHKNPKLIVMDLKKALAWSK